MLRSYIIYWINKVFGGRVFMKKFFVALSLVALLAACDDDDSSSVAPNGEPSSSSVISGSDPKSSSAEGLGSLSSSSAGFDWNLPKEAYLNPEIKYDTIIDSRDGKVYRTVTIGD